MRPSILLSVDENALSHPSGHPSFDALSHVSRIVSELREEGCDTILVTGGTSDFGRDLVSSLAGVPPAHRDNVLNAIGRARVTSSLGTMLRDRGLQHGVVTVTRSGLGGRRGHLATRETIRGLMTLNAVPVVWDDSPVLEGSQPRFTYSDQVAALIAGLVGCQSCILLSRHDGLQVPTPDGTKALREIDGMDLVRTLEDGQLRIKVPGRARVQSIASTAKLLSGLGLSLQVVALNSALSGRALLAGTSGTLVTARPQARISAIRRWLSVGAVPQGSIVVSPFAATRLNDEDRSSLLGAGVLRVEGDFNRDDVVAVVDQDGLLLGYGLTRFSSKDVVDFQGKRDVIVVHADYFFGFQLPDTTDEPASSR